MTLPPEDQPEPFDVERLIEVFGSEDYDDDTELPIDAEWAIEDAIQKHVKVAGPRSDPNGDAYDAMFPILRVLSSNIARLMRMETLADPAFFATQQCRGLLLHKVLVAREFLNSLEKKLLIDGAKHGITLPESMGTMNPVSLDAWDDNWTGGTWEYKEEVG